MYRIINWVPLSALTRYEAQSDGTVSGSPRSALATGIAGRQVLIEEIAHPEVRSMLHQKLHNIPGSVHDGAHLLETSVDQRHSIPLEYLLMEIIP